RDRDLLAEPLRQRQGAAQLLLGVAYVDAEPDVDLDRLVELGTGGLLDQVDRLGRRVGLGPVDLLVGLSVALAACHQSPSTVTPIERAVPAMILVAASRSLAFRSGILRSAIWRAWSTVIEPTISVWGSPEPFSIPAASLIRTAAGGVLVMKSKDRSS